MQSYKFLCYFCTMKVSNSIIKLVSSLDKAKARREAGLFVAEGTKCVGDLIGSFDLTYLIVTEDWLAANKEMIRRIDTEKILSASPRDMERMSHLSSSSGVIGVFNLPVSECPSPSIANEELILMLDDIRDPGNLGTIIRAADWFGIRHVVCSTTSVDVFNTKVVMATMGALARVRVSYCDLNQWLKEISAPIYGTFLDGEIIYSASLKQHGVIVMGNEGRGVSKEIAEKCTHRLFIPPYPRGAETSESLNVGMATSIVLNEFRRGNG